MSEAPPYHVVHGSYTYDVSGDWSYNSANTDIDLSRHLHMFLQRDRQLGRERYVEDISTVIVCRMNSFIISFVDKAQNKTPFPMHTEFASSEWLTAPTNIVLESSAWTNAENNNTKVWIQRNRDLLAFRFILEKDEEIVFPFSVKQTVQAVVLVLLFTCAFMLLCQFVSLEADSPRSWKEYVNSAEQGLQHMLSFLH